MTTMTDDRLVGLLCDAASRNDWVTYRNLVDNNLALVQNFDDDFWKETFHDGSDGEIGFWINYPYRTLTITDLSLLNVTRENLFQQGLSRVDLDFSHSDSVIEIMNERASEHTGTERQLMANRTAQITQRLLASN